MQTENDRLHGRFFGVNEVPLRGMKIALRANEARLRPMKCAAHIAVAFLPQSFEIMGLRRAGETTGGVMRRHAA